MKKVLFGFLMVVPVQANAIDLSGAKIDMEFQELVRDPFGEYHIIDSDPCEKPRYRLRWQMLCRLQNDPSDSSCFRCDHYKGGGVGTGLGGDGTGGLHWIYGKMGSFREKIRDRFERGLDFSEFKRKLSELEDEVDRRIGITPRKN